MIFIVAAAGIAWQSYGGAARKAIASWSPHLGWLAPAAVSGGTSPERLKAELLTPRMDQAAAEALADKLAGGHWTHDYALTASEARALGLPVKVGMPPEVMELMSQFSNPRSSFCPSTFRVRGESDLMSPACQRPAPPLTGLRDFGRAKIADRMA